jgi:hypothetical protein
MDHNVLVIIIRLTIHGLECPAEKLRCYGELMNGVNNEGAYLG